MIIVFKEYPIHLKDDAAEIQVPDVCKTDEKWFVSKFRVVADLRELTDLKTIRFLEEYEKKESIDEMKHADKLIDRLLYLDGLPNLQRYHKINVGQTVPEQLQLDLEVEKAAVKLLNDGIELCRGLGDNGSRELLEDDVPVDVVPENAAA